MEKHLLWLDEHFSTPLAKLAEQRHLRAVRQGIMATLPIMIIGSMFLIMAYPPFPDHFTLAIWAEVNRETILMPYRLTMYAIALYAAWGIGFSLAKSYGLDGVSGANLSAVALLMTQVPKFVEDIGWVLPMDTLGGNGLFVAIITAILAVEIMRLLNKPRFKLKMPEQVPEPVGRSIEVLLPTLIVVVLMTLLTMGFGLEWHKQVMKLMYPIMFISDSLMGMLIPVFLIGLFWSAGIHGVTVVSALARPIWIVLLGENTSAAANSINILPHIVSEPFFQWFIWIGGAGSTIGLVILMAFSAKSNYLKVIGRAALAPSLFNINEPVIFGAPIVLNPILIIPFVLTPMVLGVVSYTAMAMNLVTRPFVLAPWTLPSPIGAYLSTGGDWRALVLNLLCILIAITIYYPFFRVYDKRQVAIEMESHQ